MKPLQYIVISLFLLINLLVGSVSYGQIPFTGTISMSQAGYVGTDKYDTVRVRILYDIGGPVPAQKDGYVVRRWNEYHDPYHGDCMNCGPLPPAKWVDTEELLEKYYYGNGKFRYNSIDMTKVWQYKYNQ
jgi:hypothetical protein